MKKIDYATPPVNLMSTTLLSVMGALCFFPLTTLADQTEESVLEEVIVTARLREESLLEIPVSVTAIDGLTLERSGITTVDKLVGRVPSLFFAQNTQRQSTADNRSLVLRGVGSNPVLEPSVGLYVDGVYIPSLGFDLGILDVEQLEILRGPQGSLFGRNTEGGAINIITRKPDAESRVRTSLEIDDLASVNAFATVAGALIDDQLYASLSVSVSDTDGYTRNTLLGVDGDEKTVNMARLQLRYTPTDNTELLISADGSSERGREQGSAILQGDDETYDFANDFDGDMEEDLGGVSLSVNHILGDIQLKSITGFRTISSSRADDVDGIGAPLVGNEQRTFADQKSFTQEFRVESIGDKGLDWILGAYGYDDEDKYETDIQWGSVFGPPASAITSSTQERSGYALYGQLNLAAMDSMLDLTFGLRYSEDEIDGERFNFINIPLFGIFRFNPDPADPNATGKASADYDNVSGTFQMVFNVSDSFRPYVNIAQGYKGGGFDRYPTSSGLYIPFASEETTNYEVGAKGSLAGNRMTYALSVFRVDIEDLQQPTQVINPDTGLPATSIANAGEAHTQGFELESFWSVNETLSLSLSAAYTKAEFDDFIDTDGVNRAGDDIPNVPEWTVGLGADLELPISDRMDFIGSLNYNYVGERISGLNTSTDQQYDYDSYNTLDVDAGIRLDNRHEVTFFVRNAADEYIVYTKSLTLIGIPVQRVGPPRTIGLRFSTEW